MTREENKITSKRQQICFGRKILNLIVAQVSRHKLVSWNLKNIIQVCELTKQFSSNFSPHFENRRQNFNVIFLNTTSPPPLMTREENKITSKRQQICFGRKILNLIVAPEKKQKRTLKDFFLIRNTKNRSFSPVLTPETLKNQARTRLLRNSIFPVESRIVPKNPKPLCLRTLFLIQRCQIKGYIFRKLIFFEKTLHSFKSNTVSFPVRIRIFQNVNG